jgi:Right handed beta helix region
MGAHVLGRRCSTLIPLALAAIVGGASAPALAVTQGAAGRPGNITIYMAPASKGGNNSHTGLTLSSPVLTLARVQQVAQHENPAGNVTVRIEQGTYVAGAITWSFYVPGHTISFMPVNYVVGRGRPPGGDPEFVDTTSGGHHAANTWFTAVLPGSGSPLHNGGNTNLRFYYLDITDYTQAISFNGQAGHSWHSGIWYIKPSAGLNNNQVSGMTFNDIGDSYAPGFTGYGVILFTDSSGDLIANNTFSNIYNTGDEDELHALYVTHFSSYNTVEKNLFEHTNGEAVKVRDRSNYNNVTDNRFVYTGGVSAYLDDFCDEACVKDANITTYRQCASWGNRFTDNLIIGGLHIEDLIPGGETYAGGSGCSIPRGQERAYFHGNG